jgi:hypothetical protein
MKVYEKAEPHVYHKAESLIKQFHPELQKAELTLDILMATNEAGDAVSHGGYPALAVVRITNLKDRVLGMADAQITIDARAYENMTDEQRNALLDHELTHLQVLYDDDHLMKTDDIGRPKLKMKKHDYQFGWFRVIAERHGRASPEVYQARILWEKDGQAFFPMLVDSQDAA